MKIAHERGYRRLRAVCGAPASCSVSEAVRYRRPHIPNAVGERSVVVIQVPKIDRSDYEKENYEHSHMTSPLVRVRGKCLGVAKGRLPLDDPATTTVVTNQKREINHRRARLGCRQGWVGVCV